MVFPEVLALVAAGLYAASSVLVRKGLVGSNPNSGIIFSLLTNVVLMWAFSFVLVPLEYFMNWQALVIFGIAGILAPGLARMLRYNSFERLGIAKTAPISAASPIISTSLAVMFLGEKLTFAIVGGTALIIFGVIIASWKGWADRKDLAFAAAATVLVGISMPIRKAGLNMLDSPVIAGVVTASVALLLALTIIAFQGGLSHIKFTDKSLALYLTAGVCTSIAFILHFSALSLGTVSEIMPLVQTVPLFSLFLSHMFIRHLENITPLIWGGTLLAVVGTVLIGIA